MKTIQVTTRQGKVHTHKYPEKNPETGEVFKFQAVKAAILDTNEGRSAKIVLL